MAVLPKPFEKTDYIVGAILTGLSLLIYSFTMSRSIPYIDGGELTTVLWTLGIAHPTGYPLFTLIGYLFVHIPIFPEVALRANFFAALCTALATGTFYFAFFKGLQVLRDPANGNSKNGKSAKHADTQEVANGSATLQRMSSAAAVLVLAFSITFWDQSTSVEVYPLQLLLFGLILLAWLSFHENPGNRSAALAGLALGLGFANHMTTVLTLPALLFLFVSARKRRRVSIRTLLYIFGGGLAASLLYLYLPIRAAENPLMNWGDPYNLKRFIWHVTGKQFSTWMFSSFDVFQHQMEIFFTSLPGEFRISLVVVLTGIIVSFVSRRRLFWFGLLLIAGDLAYAANYNIHDISSYFLLAYISLAMFAAEGFSYLSERIMRIKPRVALAAGLLIIFPAISAAANFDGANESDDYAVEMYTNDILRSLPRNAVVLSYQWDDFVSASIYYQNVDRIRPDITIIDKELLRRSWYTRDVHERDSFLFPKTDPIYAAYQDNLRLFENDLPYDPASIENTYTEFIREIISGAMLSGREVFVGPEIETRYLYRYNRVPYGLLMELTTDTSYVPCGSDGLGGFKAAKRVSNDYSRQILGFYTQMFLARAQYEYSNKHLHRTLSWIDKSLEVDPALQTAQTARIQVLKELGGK